MSTAFDEKESTNFVGMRTKYLEKGHLHEEIS